MIKVTQKTKRLVSLGMAANLKIQGRGSTNWTLERGIGKLQFVARIEKF